MKNNALTYERIHLGELDGTEECAAILQKLAESDREILSAYPASVMEQAVLKKQFHLVQERKPVVKNGSRKHAFFTVCIPAAAAALVAFISVVAVSKTMQPDTTMQAASTIRTKGVAQNTLHLYKQNSGGITLLKNKDHAVQGDLIQISYIADSGVYGAIFSIDGNGIITRHFPDADTSAELSSGKEIPLDFSYELDGAPAFERFVFVTAQKPFSVRKITAQFKGLPPDDMMTSDLSAYIPKDASVSDMLLLK